MLFRSEGEYLNGERNGKGKEYYFNGKLRFEGEYSKGEKWDYSKVDGYLEKLWDWNRKRKRKKYFRKYMYTPKYEGEYLNGERNGKGKEYDYDGKLKFEGEYLNEERNGKIKEYNFYGQLLNGKRNGKGKEYDEKTGKLIFEGEYKNGIKNGIIKRIYLLL